jgi:hypothetical protein
VAKFFEAKSVKIFLPLFFAVVGVLARAVRLRVKSRSAVVGEDANNGNALIITHV